jgi:hypothetical protein
MSQMGRRRQRGGSVAERVERAGHAVLTRAWTVLVRIVGGLAAILVGCAAAAIAWLGRRSVPVQVLCLVGATAGAIVVVHLARTGGPAAPVIVTSDEEALARVIRSEIGGGTAQQRLHVAWATRNLAAERRQSIARMVCSPCGPQELGRPESSRQAATDADRALARQVLAAPAVLDPTGGATHFIDPELQDELAARAAPGYRGRTYAVVRARWNTSYGWEPYYRLGTDLEMWGPRRAGSRLAR